jgi:hypothetical protein
MTRSNVPISALARRPVSILWISTTAAVAVSLFGSAPAARGSGDPAGAPGGRSKLTARVDLRTTIALNGEWQRVVSADDSKIPRAGWEAVRVPEAHHDAAEGAAWFQLDFDLPAALAAEGQRVLLRFVRVRHYARVFVNGVRVGENYGSRAPFEVDITEAAVGGARNRLNVWVHHCGGAYAAKGARGLSDAEVARLSTMVNYRRQATIAEDVFLVSRPAVHVAETSVFPSVREREITVRLGLVNGSEDTRTLTIANDVWLGAALVLSAAEATVTLPPGAADQLEITTPWADPKLWYPTGLGPPTLYHLETSLREESGSLVDRSVTRFGFREIWTEGDQIVLNGRPLRLLGDWQPEASGRSVWTLRMASVQALGANVIHNHAEQREPSYYDTADEMGVLVWDANFCGGPLGTTMDVDATKVFPTAEAELARQYAAWVRTVQSHPSVVVMMAACLIHPRAMVDLAETLHQYDPSRLLLGNAVPAYPPLSVGTFGASFEMTWPDPASSIRFAYSLFGWGLRWRPGFEMVPVGVSECSYRNSFSVTSDVVAAATAKGLAYLRAREVAAVNLFGLEAYHSQSGSPAITWPSASGLGQHPEQLTIGGLNYNPIEFVNFYDRRRAALSPTALHSTIRAAAAHYLGYKTRVSTTHRPEVLITVTRGGAPVADAYVIARPIAGVRGSAEGMRTDARGTAWFQLRDAALYEFSSTVAGQTKSVVFEAPLRPLNLAEGGPRPLLYGTIAIRKRASKPPPSFTAEP